MKKVLTNVFALKKEDWRKAIPLSFYFFLVIVTFWVLKPMKRGVMINYFGDSPINLFGFSFHGAQVEQFGKVLNVFAAYLVVILFTWLVKRFPRHYLVLIFASLFSALFLLYSYLLQHLNTPIVFSFYVLGDIFNTVMVALFWAFTNDIANPEEAKRTYGVIGLGGVVGGFIGATIVARNVEDVGRPFLLIGCILPMILVVVLAFIVERWVSEEKRGRKTAAEPSKTSEVWEGAKLVFNSKYLLAIAGLVLLYELTSNVIDFQLATVVEAKIPEELKKDAFFATVGQYTGIASILIQLFLTSWVMRRFNVKAALALLPIAIFFSSLGFFIFPVLAFVAAMSVSDNSMNYSINQCAKETLYTPTPPNIIYMAKAFIDMFVQRFAKVLSVILNLAFVSLVGQNIRWLSLVTLGMVTGWYGLISYLGNEFKKKTK